MTAIEFTGPFTPVAKARARAAWTNQGPRHYTPQGTRDWEELVAVYARQAMRGRAALEGAVELQMEFWLPVPGSWAKWKRQAALAGGIAPTTKPDLDNLEKAIKDAMNGIAWGDDAQVVRVVKAKAYAASPRVEVRAAQIPNLLPAQVSRRSTT